MIGPGTRVDDRYELAEELGRGGAAMVFRGRDLELDRPVALKFLTGEGLIADPARFEEEARILASLQHPHILEVYDSGVFQNIPYLALEMVDGGNLYTRVFQGDLDPEEQLRHAMAVSSALAAAHSRDILHRDVKPENVLLTRDGVSKLSDFGLAKSAGSQVRTRTGWILGTPAFLAPEILHGEPASEASDVYAWGCLAYFLANRSPPVTGELKEILRAHRKGVYRRGKEDDAMARAIRLALEPSPKRRPSAESLEKILTGELRAPTERILEMDAERPRGAGSPAPTRSWRGALALAGLGLLGLGLALSRLSVGASTPSTSAPEAAPDARDRIEAWVARARTVKAAERIASLHERTVENPKAADYIELMARHRERPRPEVDLRALRGEAGHLLYLEEFARDREALRAVLAHPLRAPGEKAELLHALRPFHYLDQYYEAFGEPPPYGVRPLVKAAFPYDFLPGETPRPEQATVHEIGRDPGPGRYLLRQWTKDEDRTFPWLVAQGGETHAKELQWLLFSKLSTDNKWTREGHEFLRGRFRLGDEPAARYREVVLQVEVGNLFLPQLLRIEMNEVEVEVLRDPEVMTRGKWRHREVGEEVLEMSFPGEVLRPGLNAVRVTVRPLPGLLRYQGIEADRLWIELVAR